MKKLVELREEKRIDRIRTLIEILSLEEDFAKYWFNLNPENLMYDRNFRVVVVEKELYQNGERDEDEFLTQYKAVIGYAMQKKYTYEDYYEGGRDLYHKNSFLHKIGEAVNIGEIEEYLVAEYNREEELSRNVFTEVNRKYYQVQKVSLIIVLCLFLLAMALIGYGKVIFMPREEAFIKAQNSYLDENYVKVIDDLSMVDMKYLDKYQKYILASAYIKSESLTPEQKENVLQTISINSEEKIKDYWIYLGRLNTVEAENIAMQCSDDELLLYAFMTEKAILEKNTEISGEEKASRLQVLEKKIEDLAKQYEVTEDGKE